MEKTEEKYMTKSEVESLVSEVSLRFQRQINEINSQNVPETMMTTILQVGAKIDLAEAQIRNLHLQLPEVMKVEGKIRDLSNEVLMIDKKKNEIPIVKDGELKELYIKCDGLTYEILSGKLNMTNQNISNIINDKNKSQESRRTVKKFLEAHINATV